MAIRLTSSGLGSEKVRIEVPNIPVSLASAKNQALAKVKGEANNIIYSQFPLESQIDAALGLLLPQEIALLKAEVQRVRGLSVAAENVIKNTTAIDENDITPSEQALIHVASVVSWGL